MIKDNLDFNQSVKPNTEFLEQLLQKLPEFFTSSDSDKEAKFDMEKFQKALKEQNVEELSSGYQLDFIGKNYAKKQSGERPTTVIVPDNEHNNKLENKDSKNLFFTGDNLEVLRHLQQNYANSVDVIYIDPPYNTGSDGFVYPDKFEYSDDQLKDMFNLNDDELSRMKSIQGKSTHSAWLSFMYPRIYLAKKVLKDTGVIFISIDDNEQANLKLLMDEIFGEGSFIQEIAWRRTDNQPNIGNAAKVKEYILVYSKNIMNLEYGRLPLSESALKEYRYVDTDGTKFRRGILLDKTRGRHSYPITTKSGNILNGPWMVTKEKFIEMDTSDKIYWTSGGDEQPYSKIFLKDSKGAIPNDFWGIEYGTNQRASLEVERLFGERLFDFPKPVSLLKALLNLGTRNDSLILDFFAGSATTADAVMQQNAEDGGKRKYIMVQLPELTKSDSTAYRSSYLSIDRISRARIEKAAEKIKNENPLLVDTQDFGFRHFYVVEPNQQTMDKLDFDNEMQLDIFDDMISAFSSVNLDVKGNAEGLDTILQTYLVSDGYKFDVSVEMLDFAGVKLPYVNNQRIYLITNDWTAQNTKALVNAIGKNEISVQTIVVYGYTIDMESLRELEIALNQLENKVHLLVRY